MRFTILILFVSILPACYLLLTYWVKMGKGRAIQITVALAIAAAATCAWRVQQLKIGPFGPPEGRLLFVLASTALLVLFAAPLGIKLYRAWTGLWISPQEQEPGAAGVRAWLAPGNLIVSAFVAGCATVAYGYPFLGVFALLCGCLLIQPMINSAAAPALTPSPAADSSLSAEREKILSLLEAGRITAEESAGLLNALGTTAPALVCPAPISRQRRMALIGAGLVLLGFFLPWFAIHPGKELERMTGQMQGMMPGMPGMQGMSGMPDYLGVRMKMPTVHITGGDVEKGLGWLVLALGLGTAALPYAARAMDASTQRLVSFLALGIGGIVLLWLVTQNLRFLHVGAVITLAGYAVGFLGLLKARPTAGQGATTV